MPAGPEQYNPTVARVIIRGSQDGQRITNTLHVDSPDVWTSARLADFTGTIASWLNVDYMPLLSNTLSVSEIVADSLAGVNAPQYVAPLASPIVGGNASPALPNNVAYCMQLKTGFRGRSGRGRWFVAGLCENQVTGNTVSNTLRTDLNTKFGELITALLAVNMRVVVFSKYTLNNPRPMGLAFPVTSIEAGDSVVDSQRRRLPGRGI